MLDGNATVNVKVDVPLAGGLATTKLAGASIKGAVIVYGVIVTDAADALLKAYSTVPIFNVIVGEPDPPFQAIVAVQVCDWPGAIE